MEEKAEEEAQEEYKKKDNGAARGKEAEEASWKERIISARFGAREKAEGGRGVRKKEEGEKK